MAWFSGLCQWGLRSARCSAKHVSGGEEAELRQRGGLVTTKGTEDAENTEEVKRRTLEGSAKYLNT
jgi:hypothetical protein